MGYWDSRCDECGRYAVIISPMYCLCSVCSGDELDTEFDDEGEQSEPQGETK